MQSKHQIVFGDARAMDEVNDQSINLVVTSPPYPMIEMWDTTFSEQDGKVRSALEKKDGNLAFDLMHRIFDRVWDEVYRVLRPGGFACINIGDATRTLDGHFRLYANHARILHYCTRLGFSNLPAIIWRKQTNAPNKFMGSGMLPAGAYVTLEHEFILVLRKGNKRQFRNPADKLRRSQSAFFWEERNVWFSDVWWDLKGTGQVLDDSDARKRSGAFPFEIPYRLINMYSVRGDTVLDPFLGTGTTALAAMASDRNSIGIELHSGLGSTIETLASRRAAEKCNQRIRKRIEDHLDFVQERIEAHGERAFKYENRHHHFPVMTKQETELRLHYLKNVQRVEKGTFAAEYHKRVVEDYAMLDSLFACVES